MSLNHINLVVTNVAKATSFFEKHFDFKCLETKGDNIIAVLKNAADFTLVLMADKTGDTNYPKNFHIGFMQDSIEKVDTLHKQLLEDKIEVAAPKKIRDSYGFYFYFENIFIEVGYYLPQ